MNANGTLALLTDFGSRDWYVASMKGAALQVFPGVRLVDITHEISPGSISEGAYVLNRSFNDFPPGTTFVVVVDPGVGTNREPVIVEAGDYFFVGPDNGVLHPTLSGLEIINKVRIVEKSWMGKKKSTTFHGRDVFAPAGARVASGSSILEAGTPIESLVKFEFFQPVAKDGEILGHILYFDRFGNGITNLLPSHLQKLELTGVLINKVIFATAKTFGQVKKGAALSYWGSSGFLEVAIREGNAQATHQLNEQSQVAPVFRV